MKGPEVDESILARGSGPIIERHALVVTEHGDYIHFAKMIAAMLRRAGYDVTHVENYQNLLDDIRAGKFELVVYAGVNHILGRNPTTRKRISEMDGTSECDEIYVYEASDCQIIEDMRLTPQLPVPRIVFRTIRGNADIAWHCLHLPGVALLETPFSRTEFLAVVNEVML